MSATRRTLALTAALGLLVVAPPAFAGRGRTLTLKMPRLEVPPRSDREVCTFVKLPKKKAMDLGGTLIVNLGNRTGFTSHHFLVWAYTGTDPGAFPEKGVVQDGEACIDFGPPDSSDRVLIAGSQSVRQLQKLPRGAAQRIPVIKGPDGRDMIGLILNTHWINSTDAPQNASVKVKFLPARGPVKRFVQPIFEVIANGFIRVPPFAEGATRWAWRPGTQPLGGVGLGGGSVPDGDACVVMLTAHMHKRGKLFTIDHDQGTGAPLELFQTTSYSDPGQLVMTGQGPNPKPLLVKRGQRLVYECTHDNGKTDPAAVRLGCEEEDGVAPGRSIAEVIFRGGGLTGAARPCASDGDCTATDPDYPGRTFTGRCVPANLVFGFTSDDDMCILPGAYYDANPDAAPGAECDI